jgi:hypothetical protein
MKAKFRLIPGILSIVVASGFASFASAAETDSSAATSTMSSTSSAPSGESKASTKTAETYSAFAGSRNNAESLATGLRQGSEISLTDPNGGTSTTFTPATKPMGYGNVDKAMALSSQQLATAGVAQPTAEQIKTSMMGGTITNDAGKSVELQGVLQMRADGMGWGKIAQELGVKPGHGFKPAHTDSGVTSASGASSSVASKSGKAQPASAATVKHQNVSAKSSGIVSASGASAGHAKSFDKNTDQGTTHVSNSSGNHSGVSNASGHGHGGIHSASGSATHGSGDGGIAKGHLK